MLDAVAAGGIRGLGSVRDDLDGYRRHLHVVRPDDLSRDEALAYWINLNNAEALALAEEAADSGLDSLFALPGAFRRKVAVIDGEHLSLADIEHGKIRRFRDPRVHTALVCGSLSCPTLRPGPFTGACLDAELDDQARTFLASGGAVRTGDELSLSRIFRWYGGDFVRPHRMPTLLPAGGRRVARAVAPWLEPDLAAWVRSARPEVSFQRYDWALGCAIG